MPSHALKHPCTTGTKDLGLSGKHDHNALICSCCFELKTRRPVVDDVSESSVSRICKFGYDHLLFEIPFNRSGLLNEICMCNCSAPFANPSSFNHYVSKCVFVALCRWFPRAKSVPIKPWMSYETLCLIGVRKKVRANLKFAKQCGSSLAQVVTIATQFKETMRCALAATRHDYNESIRARCHAAQKASDDSDWRKFFQIKKSLSPKKHVSASYLVHDGHLYVYSKDVRATFQKYFCNILDGEILLHESAMESLSLDSKLLSEECSFVNSLNSFDPEILTNIAHALNR